MIKIVGINSDNEVCYIDEFAVIAVRTCVMSGKETLVLYIDSAGSYFSTSNKELNNFDEIIEKVLEAMSIKRRALMSGLACTNENNDLDFINVLDN